MHPRRLALLVPACLIAVTIGAPLVSAAPSTTGTEIQNLFNIVLVLGLIIGVTVAVLMIYAISKFRIRKGYTKPTANPTLEHHKLEAAWTIIPAIILLVVGVLAFQTLAYTDTIPQHPDVYVQAIGHQWYWEFYVHYMANNTTIHYPSGGFAIPVNLVVVVNLSSADVAHSLWIPAMGFHVDAIPGHDGQGWFQATQSGSFDLKCTQFCGVNHDQMVGTLTVLPS